jgi:hypothetical protein
MSYPSSRLERYINFGTPVVILFCFAALVYYALSFFTISINLPSSYEELFPIAAWFVGIVGIIFSIYTKKRSILLLSLVQILFGGMLQLFVVQEHNALWAFLAFTSVGAIMLFAPIKQLTLKQQRIYQFVGGAILFAALLFFGNGEVLEEIFSKEPMASPAMPLALFLFLYTSAMLGTKIIKSIQQQLTKIHILDVTLACCIAITVLLPILPITPIAQATPTLVPPIANILLFALIIRQIYQGIQTQSLLLIRSGFAALTLFVLVRYFDWFFSFMDKSIFFIVVGIILMVIALLLKRVYTQVAHTN